MFFEALKAIIFWNIKEANGRNCIQMYFLDFELKCDKKLWEWILMEIWMWFNKKFDPIVKFFKEIKLCKNDVAPRYYVYCSIYLPKCQKKSGKELTHFLTFWSLNLKKSDKLLHFSLFSCHKYFMGYGVASRALKIRT